MSYLVTQRTREIGLCIALGRRSADVLKLVVRRGAALAGAEIVIGAAGALAATRVLTALLYQVKPDDPETYVAIAGILGVVALLTSYLPARRATWVEPSQACVRSNVQPYASGMTKSLLSTQSSSRPELRLIQLESRL